jgi:hypothetical protein
MRAVAHLVVFTILSAIAALISYFTAFLLWVIWCDLLIRMHSNQFWKHVYNISYLCGAFLIISYEVYAVFYPLRRIFHNDRSKL